MIFDWDESKNAINQSKHGIDFYEASSVSMMKWQFYLMILSILKLKIDSLY